MQHESTGSDSIAGQSIDSGKVGKLAKLLEIGSDSSSPEIWREDELESVLRHQLDSGFEETNASNSDATDSAESCDTNLRTLLLADSTSIELLQHAKDHFKKLGAQRDALPSSVVAVCYLACISTALVRYGERISSTADSELLTNLSWAQSQSWVDASLLELFADAERILKAGH